MLKAVTPGVGHFSAADFPFGVYGTLVESPAFIHDLDGEAEWSNRLYFQMGHLIEDASVWMEALLASVLAPQVRPPTSFPALTRLERELVSYAVEHLNGNFTVRALHQAFGPAISHRALTKLAQTWEAVGLLTEHPRKVTVALRALSGSDVLSKPGAPSLRGATGALSLPRKRDRLIQSRPLIHMGDR